MCVATRMIVGPTFCDDVWVGFIDGWVWSINDFKNLKHFPIWEMFEQEGKIILSIVNILLNTVFDLCKGKLGSTYKKLHLKKS